MNIKLYTTFTQALLKLKMMKNQRFFFAAGNFCAILPYEKRSKYE
jgi:hypothetical protein